jgi:hypothetical protein
VRVEVVGMIYRSPEFLKFMRDQGYCHRIVANDPEPGLPLEGLDVFRNDDPDEHYMARSYRCRNYCVKSSPAEYVCLVSSDDACSPGWLAALVARLDGKTLPTPLIVEPFVIGINPNLIQIGVEVLGQDPVSFDWDKWFKLADTIRQVNRTEPGGMFMPCIVHRKTFLAVGGYPEKYVGEKAPDRVLFERMGAAGYKHVTCYDSVTYNFLEGEMRYKQDQHE